MSLSLHPAGVLLLCQFSIYCAFIYSVMSVLTCGLSHELPAHPQGFSGELQSDYFPEKEICSYEYIPSFSEVLRVRKKHQGSWWKS